MIKIIRKRRNPNLKGEEFIDDKFIDWLFDALLYNSTSAIQKALTYKNIGELPCTDCLMTYHRCKCEDYVDDFNLPIKYSDVTTPQLIKIVKKQFEWLSQLQLIKFRDKLTNINYNKSSYNLQKFDRDKLVKYINSKIND